ncbi:MAG: hypothetical protein CSA82_03545 [Actinobacteria bacterium]|nr:MAG: hypothetical protein CSA82_03545 [Actinomycetota bacterium]
MNNPHNDGRAALFPGSIDALRSTRHCPYCFTDIQQHVVCPSCGLDLKRSELLGIHEQSLHIADLLVKRQSLLEEMRVQSFAAQQQPGPPPAVPTTVTFPGSIDVLHSTRHCPYCFTNVENVVACFACGLDLKHPELLGIHEQSLHIADLLVKRQSLLEEVHAQSAVPQQQQALPPVAPTTEAFVPPVQPTAQPVGSEDQPFASPVAPTSPTVAAETALQAPSATQVPPSAPTAVSSSPTEQAPAAPPSDVQPPTVSGPPSQPPAAEPATRSRRRNLTAQVLLLLTGVTFLAIAAVVFLTFAFATFNLTTKAIITAGITAATILASFLLHRRKLTLTAEGIAVLGIILIALDAWAVRALDFFRASTIPETIYWGSALLVIFVICLVWVRVTSLKTPRFAALLSVLPGLTLLNIGLLDQAVAVFDLVPLVTAAIVAVTALTPKFLRIQDKASVDVTILTVTSHITVVIVLFESWIRGATYTGLFAIGFFALAVALIVQLSVLTRRRVLAAPPLFEVSAAILASLAWLSAVFFAMKALSNHFDGAEAVIPLGFIALVFWDIAIHRGRRVAGLAGAISVGLFLIPASFFFIVAPIFRRIDSHAALWPASANTLDITVLFLGLSICLTLALSVGLYIAAGAKDLLAAVWRTRMFSVIAAVGLVSAAYGLPSWGPLVALSVLLLLALAGAIAAWKSPFLRFPADALLVAASIGLLFGVEENSDVALGVSSIVVVFVLLRILMAKGEACLAASVLAIFGVLAVLSNGIFFAGQATDYVSVATIAAAALPALVASVPGVFRPSYLDRMMLTVLAGGAGYILGVFYSLPVAEGNSSAFLAVGTASLIAIAAVVGLALTRIQEGENTHHFAYASIPGFILIAAGLVISRIPWEKLTTLAANTTGLTWSFAALISAVLFALLLRKFEKNVLVGALITIVLIAVGTFNFIGNRLLENVTLNDGLTILALTGALFALGFVLLPHASGGPPTAWAGAGLFGFLGSTLLVDIYPNAWTLLIMAPLSVAFIATAVGFATRPYARTSIGSWLLAGLSGVAVLVTIASALDTDGGNASLGIAIATVGLLLAFVIAARVAPAFEYLYPTKRVVSVVASLMSFMAFVKIFEVADVPSVLGAALIALVLFVLLVGVDRRYPTICYFLEAFWLLFALFTLFYVAPDEAYLVGLLAGASAGAALAALYAAFATRGNGSSQQLRSWVHTALAGGSAFYAVIFAFTKVNNFDMQGSSLVVWGGLAVTVIALGIVVFLPGVQRRQRYAAVAALPPVLWAVGVSFLTEVPEKWSPSLVAASVGLVLALVALAVRQRPIVNTLLVGTSSAAVVPIISVMALVEGEDIFFVACFSAAFTLSIALFAFPQSWSREAAFYLRRVFLYIGAASIKR